MRRIGMKASEPIGRASSGLQPQLHRSLLMQAPQQYQTSSRELARYPSAQPQRGQVPLTGAESPRVSSISALSIGHWLRVLKPQTLGSSHFAAEPPRRRLYSRP